MPPETIVIYFAIAIIVIIELVSLTNFLLEIYSPVRANFK